MASMSTSPVPAAAVESTLKIELLELTSTAGKSIEGFLEPTQNPSTEIQVRRPHNVTEIT
jgi:hypothetical protein